MFAQTVTLADARRMLTEGEAHAVAVKAAPSLAGVETLRRSADRVLAAASLWARQEPRTPRALEDARRVCRKAAALRDTAETLRPAAQLSALGRVTVG